MPFLILLVNNSFQVRFFSSWSYDSAQFNLGFVGAWALWTAYKGIVNLRIYIRLGNPLGIQIFYFFSLLQCYMFVLQNLKLEEAM